MKYRSFGRMGWQVSEVGYGMWGMGSWSGSDDQESLTSLQKALSLGCNFFDTAAAYGNGHSEGLLGQFVRANPQHRVFTATKVPPQNAKWPGRAEYSVSETFSADHVEEQVKRSLAASGLPSFDLVQLHTWDDAWLSDKQWFHKLADLREQGLIKAIGISLNRHQPFNGVKAVRSGLVDSVQVVYNLFDQNPEDELFPACAEMNVAVIARVPFDEGGLTGTLTRGSRWPDGDFRNNYFKTEALAETVKRADALKALLPAGMDLPTLSLRYILSDPRVSTIIPGMRKLNHVAACMAASDAGPLPADLLVELHKHRWVRQG